MSKLEDAMAIADSKDDGYRSKDKSKYPESNSDGERFGEYKDRVDVLVKEDGFDLGRLTWGDWMNYCRGSYASTQRTAEDCSHWEEVDDEEEGWV